MAGLAGATIGYLAAELPSTFVANAIMNDDQADDEAARACFARTPEGTVVTVADPDCPADIAEALGKSPEEVVATPPADLWTGLESQTARDQSDHESTEDTAEKALVAVGGLLGYRKARKLEGKFNKIGKESRRLELVRELYKLDEPELKRRALQKRAGAIDQMNEDDDAWYQRRQEVIRAHADKEQARIDRKANLRRPAGQPRSAAARARLHELRERRAVKHGQTEVQDMSDLSGLERPSHAPRPTHAPLKSLFPDPEKRRQAEQDATELQDVDDEFVMNQQRTVAHTVEETRDITSWSDQPQNR